MISGGFGGLGTAGQGFKNPPDTDLVKMGKIGDDAGLGVRYW